jgi:hypothetical protein
LVRQICLSAILLLGFSLWIFVAQAQDQSRPIDVAAGHLHDCIAQQIAAELTKHTAPRRFGIVLRDKCRTQEQRFKATLIRGLKQEGALTPRTIHLVNELLVSLRHQSVANYVEMMKHHSTELPK